MANLSPSDIKKSGTYFDLAMIIGILLESEQLKPVDFQMDEYIFLGEISLNGELKSFSGVLPMIIAAKNKGFKKIILPSLCLRGASVVNGMEIFPFENLKQVIAFIEKRLSRNPKTEKSHDEPEQFEIDFSDVHGHQDIIEYVIAATAGNHNLYLY